MNKRVLAAIVIAASAAIVAACRDTAMTTEPARAPSAETPPPRTTLAGEFPPEPGFCTQTFTASGNGLAVNEPTGCYLEPQSVSTITISGMLTASPAPGALCCTTTYPEVGSYGPMGGTGSMWMQLLVKVKLAEANTQNFNHVVGSPMGSPASSVTINDVYVTGALGRFVFLERTSMGFSVSCAGNPLPPTCPYSGYSGIAPKKWTRT